MPSDAPVAAVIECRGVSLRFASESGSVDALHAVDARFSGATISVIVGPTGSGKSSLLRLLAGHDRVTEGSVVGAGHDLSGLGPRGRRRIRRAEVGFVFQRPSANLLPYLDVDEHLRLGAELRGRWRAEESEALLVSLGLADRRRHRPDELSGGEQQRLAFAMAAIGGPSVLLADEPTAELDAAATDRLLDAVETLRATGTCVVLSSHDPTVADRAGAVLALDHGRVQP